MQIRKATQADIETITNIEQRTMTMPWSFCSFSEAADSKNVMFVVAQEADVVVGYALLYLTPPEAELPDIVVDESYRRQGVGRGLLNYLIEEAGKLGVSEIYLEVRSSNTPAKTLYENIGFTDVGLRKNFYNNPVEDAICMRLTF